MGSTGIWNIRIFDSKRSRAEKVRSELSSILFESSITNSTTMATKDVAREDLLLVHDESDLLWNLLGRRVKFDWTIPICAYSEDVDVRRAVVAIRKGVTDYFDIACQNSLTERVVVACVKGREEYEQWAKLAKFKSGLRLLTPREHEVAGLIAAGTSFDDIAEGLGVSVRTVQVTARNAYLRLGIKRKYELVAHSAYFG